MKIKKSLFTTEINLEIDEIRQIRTLHPYNQRGLIVWLRDNFGLNLYSAPKLPKKDENSSNTQ